MLIAALVLAPVVVVLAVLLATTRRAAVRQIARLAAVSRELEALQHAFSRFAPPVVVEDIIASGVSTHSEKKEITVLFADLRGFTALAERLDPSVLVAILNGWVERMSQAITANRGHVAKLIGDGLLALFGALEANPWQVNDAVHAALAMRAALVDYNASLTAAGRPALAMGVGIDHGVAVAGVMGSGEVVEYGVIGHTVNLAARVETLTRVHGVDVLVTDAVRAVLDPGFRLRPMPAAEVKGMDEAVVTFAVEAFAPAG